MKTTLALTLALLLVVVSFSCTDQDKIAAAIQDGKELNEGDQVGIRLSQNYPNPFNPTTVIGYAVACQMHIRLRVLTEDWQEVATLVDDTMTSGFFQIHFDASGLPSGEYYYTLEGSGVTIIRRMELVK